MFAFLSSRSADIDKPDVPSFVTFSFAAWHQRWIEVYILIDPVDDRISLTAPVCFHVPGFLPYPIMPRDKGGVKLVMQCAGALPDFIISSVKVNDLGRSVRKGIKTDTTYLFSGFLLFRPGYYTPSPRALKQIQTKIIRIIVQFNGV